VDTAPEHALCCDAMHNAVVAGLGIVRADDGCLLDLASLVEGETFI